MSVLILSSAGVYLILQKFLLETHKHRDLTWIDDFFEPLKYCKDHPHFLVDGYKLDFVEEEEKGE